MDQHGIEIHEIIKSHIGKQRNLFINKNGRSYNQKQELILQKSTSKLNCSFFATKCTSNHPNAWNDNSSQQQHEGRILSPKANPQLVDSHKYIEQESKLGVLIQLQIQAWRSTLDGRMGSKYKGWKLQGRIGQDPNVLSQVKL